MRGCWVLQLARRRISRGSYVPYGRDVSRLFWALTEPKIDQGDVTARWRCDYVIVFDIAVQNASFMHVGKSIEYGTCVCDELRAISAAVFGIARLATFAARPAG